ncbi:hypothetical protein JHJ32_02110 [Parapedobacter sp. ISTM3]|uniref:DUF5683 domain-containing protein n=1 Tax=Parapedobacter sp. ISTM3 TaxID=2800130 RepID=UPI0019075394|nr:DUF5683 domain-containing protein [Parapedobacter sp. ISTM3]MBK1438768.1 hypothetical protein [Parapedobacter sp. ISTM3]
MNRWLVIVLLVLGTVGGLHAQEPDSLRRDTIPKMADTLAVDTAGRQADETRRERRQRERREREAQEQKQTVFKDSARLALEAMSVRPWKQSLMVPGWGQITNGGWWWLKVPVIYGGFVGAVLVFEFNNRYYHDVLREAQYRINNNHAIPPNTKFPYLAAGSQATDRLVAAKDYYRRNRDLTVLVTVGWWGIQAVEAYVTSMLKHRWDIGDDLGFRISPTLLQQPPTSLAYQHSPYAIGLKVGFRF